MTVKFRRSEVKMENGFMAREASGGLVELNCLVSLAGRDDKDWG